MSLDRNSLDQNNLWGWQGLGSGQGGSLQQAMGRAHRPTPAEDVADAIRALNNALAAAANAGWGASLSLDRSEPILASDRPTYQIVKATISRDL